MRSDSLYLRMNLFIKIARWIAGIVVGVVLPLFLMYVVGYVAAFRDLGERSLRFLIVTIASIAYFSAILSASYIVPYPKKLGASLIVVIHFANFAYTIKTYFWQFGINFFFENELFLPVFFGFLFGIASGFYASFTIFKNRGWHSPSSDDIPEEY